MRITSRLATAAAVFAFAVPMFRPVQAREAFRTASVRPTEPDSPRAQQRESQVIVQFRTDTAVRDVARVSRDGGAARMKRSSFGNDRYLMTLDAGFTAKDAIERMSSAPEVEYVEPNGAVHAFFKPNDTGFPVQWNFRMLDAERTWDIQKGDPQVIVAVLDTGIAYEDFGPYRKAPDFGGTTFVAGFDFINNDAHANDDNFHGTHVASTIAEATDNSEGVTGLAFRCGLMPVKVLDENGDGSFFDVAEGIDFAREHGAKVINLSLGGEGNSATVRTAIDRAVAADITIVAAAGNDGRGSVSFPAALPNVIAVGAIDGRKQRAPYSNFGPEIDLVAPGGNNNRDDTGANGVPDGRPDGILQQTLDPDSAERGIYTDFGYFFVTGTSQATPHVAALAALLYQQGITKPEAIKAAMEQTAEDLGSAGRDDTFGNGLIRPAVALKGLGLNIP